MATVLSFCVPGLGYLYAGDARRGVRTFFVTGLLLWLGLTWSPLVLVAALAYHLFQAVAAAGVVRRLNAERGGYLAGVPPPPGPGSRPRAAPRETEATVAEPRPRPVREPLDPEGFLAELHQAWLDHRDGRASEQEFQRRKAEAVDRIRVSDPDEGTALLEASSELVGAGVLTSRERALLQTRLGRT